MSSEEELNYSNKEESDESSSDIEKESDTVLILTIHLHLTWLQFVSGTK